MSPAERDDIASDAATRYRAGETWAQIAADHGITAEHVRRLTVARHDITYRRWGKRPTADADEVAWMRAQGWTLDRIAAQLGCSRQAVRTALEAVDGPPLTRYPPGAGRRRPTSEEAEHLRALYDACPLAERARPGHRNTAGPEGLVLARVCADIVTDGVTMDALSLAMGRGANFVCRLLARHDLLPKPHPARTTSRRTRTTG